MMNNQFGLTLEQACGGPIVNGNFCSINGARISCTVCPESAPTFTGSRCIGETSDGQDCAEGWSYDILKGKCMPDFSKCGSGEVWNETYARCDKAPEAPDPETPDPEDPDDEEDPDNPNPKPDPEDPDNPNPDNPDPDDPDNPNPDPNDPNSGGSGGNGGGSGGGSGGEGEGTDPNDPSNNCGKDFVWSGSVCVPKNPGTGEGDGKGDGEGEEDGKGDNYNKKFDKKDSDGFDSSLAEEWDQKIKDTKDKIKDKIDEIYKDFEDRFTVNLPTGGGSLPCYNFNIPFRGTSMSLCFRDYDADLSLIRYALMFIAAVFAAYIVMR